MLPSILIAAASVTAAVAGWTWRRELSRETAPLGLLAFGMLLLLLFQAAGSVASMLQEPWNFIRLAPSLALIGKEPLYPGADEGPILGWIYGPLLPWLNLPAVLIPHPVGALTAAGILNEILLLLPLLRICTAAMPPTPSGRMQALILLAVLHAGLLCIPASQYWLRNVHADTPALGFSLAGLIALMEADPLKPIGGRRLLAAGTLMVLGVLGKQTAIGVIPAALGFAGLRDGLRAAGLLAAATAGAGALLGAVCLIGFGAHAFWLNVVRIPSAHPWEGPFREWGLELLEQVLVPLGLLLVALWRGGSEGKDWRDRLRQRPWPLLLLAAATMVPLSLAGRAKVGGYQNAYHSVYFLMAALAWVLAARLGRARPGLIAGTAAAAILLGTGIYSTPRPTFEDSRLAREYRFAQAQRGQVWMLDNPLATAYSDGLLYHQGYGVYDRILARVVPPASVLATHRPAALRWVSAPGHPFWQPEGLMKIPSPGPGLGNPWYRLP